MKTAEERVREFLDGDSPGGLERSIAALLREYARDQRNQCATAVAGVLLTRQEFEVGDSVLARANAACYAAPLPGEPL